MKKILHFNFVMTAVIKFKIFNHFFFFSFLLEKNKAESKSKEALMTAGSFVEEVIRYQVYSNIFSLALHPHILNK